MVVSVDGVSAGVCALGEHASVVYQGGAIIERVGVATKAVRINALVVLVVRRGALYLLAVLCELERVLDGVVVRILVKVVVVDCCDFAVGVVHGGIDELLGGTALVGEAVCDRIVREAYVVHAVEVHYAVMAYAVERAAGDGELDVGLWIVHGICVGIGTLDCAVVVGRKDAGVNGGLRLSTEPELIVLALPVEDVIIVVAGVGNTEGAVLERRCLVRAGGIGCRAHHVALGECDVCEGLLSSVAPKVVVLPGPCCFVYCGTPVVEGEVAHGKRDAVLAVVAAIRCGIEQDLVASCKVDLRVVGTLDGHAGDVLGRKRVVRTNVATVEICRAAYGVRDVTLGAVCLDSSSGFGERAIGSVTAGNLYCSPFRQSEGGEGERYRAGDRDDRREKHPMPSRLPKRAVHMGLLGLNDWSLKPKCT